MSLHQRLARLEGRCPPVVGATRITIEQPEGGIESDQVMIPGAFSGQATRSCTPEAFPRLYPDGQIIRHIILEYHEPVPSNSLAGHWLASDPARAVGEP
jgi:hypothetical protein